MNYIDKMLKKSKKTSARKSPEMSMMGMKIPRMNLDLKMPKLNMPKMNLNVPRPKFNMPSLSVSRPNYGQTMPTMRKVMGGKKVSTRRTPYMVYNKTDRISAAPFEFDTREEAEEYKKEFPKRFEHQGFYKTFSGERIDPEDVELEIVETEDEEEELPERSRRKKLGVRSARTLNLKSKGEDYWGRKTFVDPSTKRVYKDVDGQLNTTTRDGEPLGPLRKDIKVNVEGAREIDIGKKYWGFKREPTGKTRLSVGNFSDAGFYDSSEDDDIMEQMIRLKNSKVRGEFIETMKKEGVPFSEIKPLLKQGAKKGVGLYELSGDNVRWRFGDIQTTRENTDEELEEYAREKGLKPSQAKAFVKFYKDKSFEFSPEKHPSFDYDEFEKLKKSKYSDRMQSAVESSQDYEDFFENVENVEEDILEDVNTLDMNRDTEEFEAAERAFEEEELPNVELGPEDLDDGENEKLTEYMEDDDDEEEKDK